MFVLVAFLYVCYLPTNLNILLFVELDTTCSGNIRSKERSTTSLKKLPRQLSSTLFDRNQISSLTSNVQPMKIFQWFQEPQFYLVACIYVAARLFVVFSQIYIIFYVSFTLRLSEDDIAIVPMVMSITGFLISFVLKFLSTKVGLKVSFVLSGITGLGMFLLLLYR